MEAGSLLMQTNILLACFEQLQFLKQRLHPLPQPTSGDTVRIDNLTIRLNHLLCCVHKT